jgi:hypothetical protein
MIGNKMNNNSPIILESENFLSKEMVSDFRDFVLSENMVWRYNSCGTVQNYDIDNHAVILDGMKNTPQFVHVLYHNGRPVSDLYDYIMQIFENFINFYNIEKKSVLRAKINLNTKNYEGSMSPAHVDYNFPHYVFLYYFNNSDGDTIIFNEKYDGEKKYSLEENSRLSPQEGKAILFDGTHYHSPSLPKDSDERAVLNIAFI